MAKLNFRRIFDPQKLLAAGLITIASLLMLAVLSLLWGAGLQFYNVGIIGVVFGLPACWFAYKYWQQSFFLFIFILTFEGMVRNLANQAALLLIKDALLCLIYVGYLKSGGWRQIMQPDLRRFTQIFLVLSAYCLVEVLNPAIPDFSIGIIGFRTHLLYIPMLFVAYEVLNTQIKVKRFVLYVLILSLGSCAVGLYQYIGGYEVLKLFQPVNIWRAWGTEGVFYKLPGSFAAFVNFAPFLEICYALAMGILYSKTSGRLKFFSLLCIVLYWVMVILMSHRAAWIFNILCFLLGTFTQSSRPSLRTLRVILAVGCTSIFILLISVGNNIISDRLAQFTSEGGNGVDIYLQKGFIQQVTEQLQAIGNGRFFGTGIGMATPGTVHVLTERVFVESFLAMLLYELGPIGFGLTIWLLFTTLWRVWQAYRATTNPQFKNLIFFSLVFLGFIVATSITYIPLPVPPTAQFFWVLTGLALRIESWEKPVPDELNASREYFLQQPNTIEISSLGEREWTKP